MAKPASSPIPEGFHTVTPHMICKDAAGAIEFYKKAFGAEEVFRMPGPGGVIMHAEIQIGNSRIMLADEFPDMNCKGPKSIGGSPVTIHLYVNDADAAFEKATKAGATVTMPVTDMFWGDRYGKVEDPYGHHWSIATHKTEFTPEEIMEGAQKAFGG
jgi:PhnB protein